MSFSTFGSRTARLDGVVVAEPTVKSLVRAIEVYGTEIDIIREAIRKSKDGLTVDSALSLIVAARGADPRAENHPLKIPDRLSYVLDGLLSGEKASQVLSTSSGAMSVLRAVVHLIAPSLGAINELLGTPATEGEVVGPKEVDSGTMLILVAAERFHRDPFVDLPNWPVSGFVDVVKAYSTPVKPVEEKPWQAPDVSQEHVGVVGGATRATDA